MKKSSTEPASNFFKSETNEFRFLNLLGKAHARFADIGELLAIQQTVNENDPASFVGTYTAFADKCKAVADDCLKNGHTISARYAYFRASTYYVGAMEYLDEAGQTDKFLPLFKTHRQCWKAGMQLMDLNYEEFDIPYEGTTIKGFFIGRKNDKSKRPLCIFNNGSDGPILDFWTMGGEGMLERGYNLLTFDGPGQGSSLFEKNMPFRHDWENVIKPVIDFIVNREDVDQEKIVLYGISQAGYWVPRAAAFEKRLKAIVADPGVVDVGTSWLQHLSPDMMELFNSGNKELFNKYLLGAMKENKALQAIYDFRVRPYRKDNPFDAYTEVLKYNIDGIADKISCAAIIISPEDETFWPGQSEQLYDMIKSPKQLINFTREEGGNYHCEPKSRVLWEQKVLDRVDEVLRG